MKSYTIHFIRHGMTAENQRGAYMGSKDVPLSAKGIEMLKKYDSEMKYPGTPILFSSPMLRCIQSCNIIYPALKPIVLDSLKECCFGDWEGKTAEELKDNSCFAKWLANSVENSPPNGENGAEFIKRICTGFEKVVHGLMETGETTAVIMSHGGVIMNLLSVYGIPQAKPYDWMMDNGFGYSVRISPLLWMRDKVIEVYGRIPEKKE